MADQPQRALVLFGDGLLADRLLDGAAAATTTLQAAQCPHLDELARNGCSGFLALREAPTSDPACGRSEQLLHELAQLLDVHEHYSVSSCCSEALTTCLTTLKHPSAGCLTGRGMLTRSRKTDRRRIVAQPEARAADATAAALDNGEPCGGSDIPSLAERFMGMSGLLLTASPAVARLGRRCGFTVDGLSTPSASGSSPPDAAATAARLLAALGLHHPRAARAPPSITPLPDGEYDLVLLHLEAALAEAPKTDELATDAGCEERWSVAVEAICWLDALVAALRAAVAPGSKGEAHLYLVIVLSYGDNWAVQQPGSGGLPGELALLPTEDAVAPELRHLRPRQSYELKGGAVVQDLRYHHPLLVAYDLEGVTRRDDARCLDVQECRERGGNLSILVDRFLHEIAFKLWRAPKYGA
eukprot:SM000051S17596  [mRNA]  locus=s51:686419:688779:+ [translate_table: standard]